MGHHGLHRVDVEEATAGDIVCISGFDELFISDTLCDMNHVEAMKPLTVDEPTVSMTFGQRLAVLRQGRQVRHQP